MTETDWLLLRQFAANPHDRPLVEWSLRQRQYELELVRARVQSSAKSAQSFYHAVLER
jgi:hypothetical protein